MEWKNDDYIITDNQEELDAEGIPREVVEQSIEHSPCFGLFHGPGK